MEPAETLDTGLSLRTALELPEMMAATVVAGEQGLDRRVTGVNIVEVPDVSRWLRGGELLFSAGYAWRTQPSELVPAIREFHAREVAGLAVKLGTYMDQFPTGVLQAADDLGFPIVRLPPSVAYMDIIDPLVKQLSGRRLEIYERLQEAGRQLLDIGLDEQSIEGVVALLAEQVGTRIYALDLVDEAVVLGQPDGSAERSSMGTASGDAGRIVAAFAGEELSRRRALSWGSFGGDLNGFWTPLVVAHEVRGVLVAAERGAVGAPRQLDDLAHRLLWHGAELLSFLLLKRLAHLEGQRTSSALLVRSLLEDQLTPQDAIERARALGLRLGQPTIVLVLGSAERMRPAELENLRRGISRILGSIPHAIGPDEDRTIVVVQVGQDGVVASTEMIAERLLCLTQQHRLSAAVIGIGGAYVGLDGLRRSRVEAGVAYRARLRARVGGGAVHFSGLGVEGLLSQIPSSEVTQHFVEATIGPIADDPELLRTLEVYVESGGRKLATAAKLPLHRSSLEYRLAKITRLLGVDLTNPERCSELWLALRLGRLNRGC